MDRKQLALNVSFHFFPSFFVDSTGILIRKVYFRRSSAMKKFNALSLFFFAVVIADLMIMNWGEPMLRFLSKPMLMPVLIFTYYASVKPLNFYSRCVCLALFFSWVGDILLMFESSSPVFFIGGLTSFLMAHITYIYYFLNTRSVRQSYFRSRPLLLLPVAVIVIELLNVLWTSLGPFKLPVIIYGIVIGSMFAAALWQYKKLNNMVSLWFIAGAFSFILSDSILAINKFSLPFKEAGFMIMFTYCFAQYAIARGSLLHIKRGLDHPKSKAKLLINEHH